MRDAPGVNVGNASADSEVIAVANKSHEKDFSVSALASYSPA
jgi:hypothetical protein